MLSIEVIVSITCLATVTLIQRRQKILSADLVGHIQLSVTCSMKTLNVFSLWTFHLYIYHVVIFGCSLYWSFHVDSFCAFFPFFINFITSLTFTYSRPVLIEQIWKGFIPRPLVNYQLGFWHGTRGRHHSVAILC